MRALLLAAGLGSRLLPVTATVPKCLVTIDGRPLLDYWLELLFGADIERVLINTHWLAGQVDDYVKASRWASRIDLVHEDQLLGTGGTVLANRRWLRASHSCSPMPTTDFDVAGLIAAHRTRPAGHLITMLGFRTPTHAHAASWSSTIAIPWWRFTKKSNIRRETSPTARSTSSNPRSST